MKLMSMWGLDTTENLDTRDIVKKFQPILAEIKNELMSDDVEVADLSTRNIVSLTVS